MFGIVEYETQAGLCPFSDWFDDLPTHAALKVRTAVARIEAGNLWADYRRRKKER